MSNVLVTGGAGFIGSHVAEELLRMGHRVVVLDDCSGGVAANVPAGADFVTGTILDEALLDRLFAEHRFTHVYHLAAYAAEGLSHFIRQYNYQTNLVGSINLINRAVRHEVGCFVFTSSIAVYGRNQVPYTEATVPEPEDPYGIAKYAVELDLRNAHEMFGLNHVIFRPHNVYGERQNIGDKYRNVIGIFMNCLLHGKEMPIFGDGTQTRAFSYIDDVAIPIARAGFRPACSNQVFNIGADRHYSVNELAQEVARALGLPPRTAHLPARNEVHHAYSAHERARAEFADCIRDVGLGEGIRRMAEWARALGPQETRPFTRIEITKNLPPSWKVLT